MATDPLDPDARAKLMQQLGLTDTTIRRYINKIAWRREMKKALRAEFDEKYPEDCLTMFLMSGIGYFDKEICIARKSELASFKPYATASNKEAILFHQRIKGRRYLIGADPASGRQVSTTVDTSGKPNTDYSAAVVLDMETAEEMASFRSRVTPSDFAGALDELGRYYNECPIAVERTGDGGSVILVLSGDYKYPSIVKFKEWHRKNKKMIEIEGFPTNLRTRPIALNFVNKSLTDNPELVWDKVFLNEALTFVRDERGIPAGAPGTHDDTVSARWIAHGSRMHLLGYWVPGEGRRETYMNADQLAAAS